MEYNRTYYSNLIISNVYLKNYDELFNSQKYKIVPCCFGDPISSLLLRKKFTLIQFMLESLISHLVNFFWNRSVCIALNKKIL